jgi:internalin A
LRFDYNGVIGAIAISIGIAVAPPPSLDGLSIARERIAKEAEENTGFLDMGELGLTELPEELFHLKHLRRLNLGAGYYDAQREWQRSVSEIHEKNSVGNLGRLAELNEVQSLSLGGTALSDLAGFASIANIVEIDCSGTRVDDLAPLAGLSNLQSLNCCATQVSDLARL